MEFDWNSPVLGGLLDFGNDSNLGFAPFHNFIFMPEHFYCEHVVLRILDIWNEHAGCQHFSYVLCVCGIVFSLHVLDSRIFWIAEVCWLVNFTVLKLPFWVFAAFC